MRCHRTPFGFTRRGWASNIATRGDATHSRTLGVLLGEVPQIGRAVSKAQISQWMSGTGRPTVDQYLGLARLLGVDIYWLVWGLNERKPEE